MANATSSGVGPLAFKLFIPSIDPDTGFFVGYYLIGPKGEKPFIHRIMGMGASTPDGVLTTVRW